MSIDNGLGGGAKGVWYGRQVLSPQDFQQNSQFWAGLKFQGEQAGQQRAFEGEQGAAQRAAQLGESQIAANASMYPAQLKQDRFNQLFPFLQQQYQGLGSNPFTAGGQSPASPEITVGPVWNGQQVQQQVNASRASTDQATAARTRAMQQGLAGRGVGANSPLAQALAGQLQSSGLATNVGNERETRMNAATANTQNVFQTQQAREQQFAQRQQEDIARRQPYFAHQNALLAALTGLA